MSRKTNAEIAKEMVNKVYQPTGFLNHKESSDTMWEWSKNRVVEFLDFIIESNSKGSDIWSLHTELKKETLKL